MSTPPLKTAAEPDPESPGVFHSQSVEWFGPIPPPAALEHVDRVVPGGADRILQMAEREHVHRIELEKIAVNADVQDAKRSKFLGAGIATLAILGAVVNVFAGGAWQATCAFLGVPILGVVNALVQRRSRQG